jgi:lipopolysaccharide export system permease protein
MGSQRRAFGGGDNTASAPEMKIIERYFAVQFITAFIWTIVSFVFFYLVFDLFSRINLIIDGTIPPGSVAEYYLSMTPLVFVQVCPLAVLLATMYTFSNMARHNELIAAVGGGKHPYKIFFVFLFLGLLISLLSAAVNEKNVPEAARRAHGIRFSKMEEETKQIWQNRVIYGSENRRFFIKQLDISEGEFSNFEMTKFSSAGSELVKFQADGGIFDEGAWLFKDIIFRRFDEEGGITETVYAEKAKANRHSWLILNGTVIRRGRETRSFESLNPEMEGIPETPEDFTAYRLRYDEMDFARLREYIRRLRNAGFDPRPEIIALHTKLSLPLASFILMLLGISLSVKQRKGGFLIGFGTALGTALAYYLVMNTGSLLGETLIHPAAGAWLANAVFFIPGFYFLLKAKYISY